MRKIGSRPWVWLNLAWTFAADTDMPSLGWWQEPQERPFVPRLWKNGPVRSIPPLMVLYVSDSPVGFRKKVPLGTRVSCCPLAPTIAISTAKIKRTRGKSTRLDWRVEQNVGLITCIGRVVIVLKDAENRETKVMAVPHFICSSKTVIRP